MRPSPTWRLRTCKRQVSTLHGRGLDQLLDRIYRRFSSYFASEAGKKRPLPNHVRSRISIAVAVLVSSHFTSELPWQHIGYRLRADLCQCSLVWKYPAVNETIARTALRIVCMRVEPKCIPPSGSRPNNGKAKALFFVYLLLLTCILQTKPWTSYCVCLFLHHAFPKFSLCRTRKPDPDPVVPCSSGMREALKSCSAMMLGVLSPWE